MQFFDETQARDPRVRSEIFVFGSNLAGIHGAGAAKFANYWYAAAYGIGRGRTGKSYAIPTKDADFNVRSLVEIAEDVTIFLQYARQHSNLKFLVTRIGCGYAGYSNDDIAPMFRGAPENCIFEQSWRSYLIVGCSAG